MLQSLCSIGDVLLTYGLGCLLEVIFQVLMPLYLPELACQRECHHTESKEVPQSRDGKPGLTSPLGQGIESLISATEKEFSKHVSERHKEVY